LFLSSHAASPLLLLGVDRPLASARRPRGDGVVHSLALRIQHDGEHAAGLRRPEHERASLLAFLYDRVAVADCLNFLGDDVVAGNVSYVPRIPDQAPNNNHTPTIL